MTKIVMNITGHRPEALVQSPEEIRERLKNAMITTEVNLLYQGMAAGVDLWSAGVAWQLGIPYVACRPWAGHTPRNADKKLYQWVIDHAQDVVDVDPSMTYPGAFVYHVRNQYMVDESPDGVIAVWNGVEKGGTYACVKYARTQKRRIYRVDPTSGMTSGTWIHTADVVTEPVPDDLFSSL